MEGHTTIIDCCHLPEMSDITYSMSQNVCHFYFHDNFGNSGPVIIICHCLIQKGSVEEDGIISIISTA